jgi:flagellar secretion chaperone FliS
MGYTPQSAYAQNEVLNASPERLVELLYDLGIRSIARARECNRSREIAARTRELNKAFAVLVELGNGLDFEAGGDIALNYGRIYDYCQRKLIEANVKQSDAILAEVQSLLEELKEAWAVVVIKVGAARTAQLLCPDILPSEEALAGSVNCLG